MSHSPTRTAMLVALNALLLLGMAGAIGGIQVGDRDARAVEAAIRRYAAGVTSQQLADAVGELAPAARPSWSEWVAGQLGNAYDVKAVSVRTPSVLDRLLRRARGGPYEATVTMDVNRGFPDEFYQPTTRVGVRQVDGRWYLLEPLLARESVEQ